MALHRELEQYHTNEFTITASAPMAPSPKTVPSRAVSGYTIMNEPEDLPSFGPAHSHRWHNCDGSRRQFIPLTTGCRGGQCSCSERAYSSLGMPVVLRQNPAR